MLSRLETAMDSASEIITMTFNVKGLEPPLVRRLAAVGGLDHRPLADDVIMADLPAHIHANQRRRGGKTWPCMGFPAPYESVVLWHHELVTRNKRHEFRKIAADLERRTESEHGQ